MNVKVSAAVFRSTIHEKVQSDETYAADENVCYSSIEGYTDALTGVLDQL